MGSSVEQLLKNYRDLIAILDKQLHIAQMDRYDDQLYQVEQLEQQKSQHVATINIMGISLMESENISNEETDEITNYISELQRLNRKLQDIINSWYNEDSSSMIQVTSHRRTLQSYGGVNHTDVISYFIDDKK